MFFYDFENLDNFINTTLTINITEEQKHINDIILLYDKKKITLLNITNHLLSMIKDCKKDDLIKITDIVSKLEKSINDLEYINQYSRTLINNLYSLQELSTNLIDNYNAIKAILIEYNKQDEKLQNEILLYEKNITSILDIIIELSISGVSDIKDNNIIMDNNVLIISEKNQKAYLPYRYSDIEKIYTNSNNTYSSFKDVIEKLYIVPLNRFKNSSISRFREGFNLIKNKENGSIAKALDLGFELLFKYDLNPIIIAACRNLDELDIYLDCLEENELYDFDCFEIKFEVTPGLSTPNKKIAFSNDFKI